MDKPRPSFQVRRQADGDVLVWRQPGSNEQVRRQLLAAGLTHLSNSIRVGRYCGMTFVPAGTPAAIAALAVEMVQERICTDLQIRLRGAVDADVDIDDAPMGARYILNSAVVTAPGDYTYRLINADEARSWAGAGGFTSTVGYEQTAAALTQLLGVEVPVDRRTITMARDDEALVFRLVFPAGTPRIDPQDKGRLSAAILAGHYELGLLKRRA